MSAMRRETGEDERLAQGADRPYGETYFRYAVWYVRVAAVAYLILVLATYLRDDLARAKMLYGAIRVFQTVARKAGEWALQTEDSYNRHVDSLH